ncbi:MAG: monovalent cation:proton antiporter family protein [Chloroflexota bacterium]|nr:monovalent cation:proton antiporter family protein [Chloroflexota bacterium]
MEENANLAPVLLVVALAFLVPLLLSRFKHLGIPVVVGEIIAGMIIGSSGLNLVHESAMLEVLAALGFAFLMFLSGLEIDFSLLQTANRDSGSPFANPVVPAVIILSLTIAMSLGFAFALTAAGLVESPWLLALIMSTTSLGIVLPVLRERGLSGGLYGQTVLISALVADFVTMVLITAVVALLSGGLTLEVLLVGVLLVVFVLAARFAPRVTNWEPIRRGIDEMAHATVQIKVRGALAVMFTFVVLSDVLGAEVILGAFLAGAFLALVSGPDDPGDWEVKHKLDAIGFGFLIPVFFIMVGVRFDLPALLSSASALVLFPILLLIAYLVKVVPSMILRRHYSTRQSVAAGFLLSSRLSLIIAASAIGLRLGLISDAINADIVLVAIVTSTLSPAIFSRLIPDSEDDVGLVKPTFIVGAGRAGVLLGQALSRHGDPVIYVDHNETRLRRARQAGFEAVLADATQASELARVGIENARALVVATSDDDFNLKVSQIARNTFGCEHIISYLQDTTRLREFEAAGVRVVNPVLASASMMESLVRFPDAYFLLTAMDDDKDVVEIELRNPRCDGIMIRDMRLPGDVLVLAIRRRGELFVPHGDNRLMNGDHVTLLGTGEAVEEAVHLLQQSSDGAGRSATSDPGAH